MGCFSFLCDECGEGIESDSYSGQKARLYWLKDGKVHQEMRGQYNSYGEVFNEDCSESYHWSNKEAPLLTSQLTNDAVDVWPEPMFGKNDGTDGLDELAAVHESCFVKVPTSGSEDDPNQGWGKAEDEDDDYY